MTLDDLGLEVLRKAAEENAPASKTDYRHKVRVVESALPDGAATEATLQSVLNAVDGLEGFVDQLESLATTTNSLLTTIRDNADGLEGFTDGLESLLASILAAVDGLEGFTDGLEGFTDGLEGSLTSIDGKLTPSTGTLSSVPASAGSTTLIAANASRKGFRLYNDSTQACFVAYESNASSSAFTLRLPANEYHVEERYTGIVSGIWGVAVGAMKVTELT